MSRQAIGINLKGWDGLEYHGLLDEIYVHLVPETMDVAGFKNWLKCLYDNLSPKGTLHILFADARRVCTRFLGGYMKADDVREVGFKGKSAWSQTEMYDALTRAGFIGVLLLDAEEWPHLPTLHPIYSVVECRKPVTEPEIHLPESPTAHKYCDGKEGIEIGGAAHNDFGIKGCINVDRTETGIFQEEQHNLCGWAKKVDVVAQGDDLPFKDNSLDYVLSSHVLEHFWSPIRALEEWMRVLRPGGHIVAIIPHPERTFDKGRALTTVDELCNRHLIEAPKDAKENEHFSVWTPETFKQLCEYLKYKVVESLDTDDKAGNGFMVVIEKC